MTVALGLSPAGVDYGAPDGKPVHIVLLMIASRDQARERIEVLSAFSRMMRKESVRQDLLRARSADEALETLYREADSSEGAEGGAAPRPAA
jgi:PTS system fructose-specific IIC component